jgi:putative addiction module antidote
MLKRIGNATGVVLPEEMLRHLDAKEGQEVFAIEFPTGYLIMTLDPAVQKQVQAGEDFMDRYRDVFAALAK